MRSFLLLIFFSGLGFFVRAQELNSTYNKSLADSLGSDDYGMKQYMFVILKTGTNKTSDKKLLDSLFTAHMNNIKRLADEGKLIVAGPFGKNDKAYRGLFILNVKSEEEAIALLETDPTIKEKIFEVEITPWYGSAALPTYLKVHESVSKFK